MRRWAALLGIWACAGAMAGPLPVPAGARPASARTAAVPVPAWDCWVDAVEGGGIRCIVDRDRPLPPPDDYTDDDEAAEVLLELVHDYLHRGKPGRASELVREESHLLRRDDLWTVRLSAPPLETSWHEERPQRLVRSLLCRGSPACAVRFHR